MHACGLQVGDDGAVGFIQEEVADVLRHHRADAVNSLQIFFVGGEQCRQFAVVAGKQFGADVADFADAEGVDEAGQRRLFCGI